MGVIEIFQQLSKVYQLSLLTVCFAWQVADAVGNGHPTKSCDSFDRMHTDCSFDERTTGVDIFRYADAIPVAELKFIEPNAFKP